MDDKNFGGVELPNALSEKDLRRSYWWVTHRERVTKIAFGLFIALDVLLVGYGAWGFIDWLAVSGAGEDRAIRQMTLPAYGKFGGIGEVRELRFEEPAVFTVPGGRYDIIALVQNENPRHWAELTYRFSVGGEETPERTAFVLPGQAKYLTELGYKKEASEAGAGSVELKVLRRAWSRIDAHEIPDYESFAAKRLALEVVNPAFFPAIPGTSVPVSRTTFTLANRSAFSYYDIDVLVLLYRGEAVVAANKIRVNRLRAGESRPTELFWYQPLPQVTRVEVVPDINILDPDVYKAP